MTLLVAGTFVCTFLVVCAIAYFFLRHRSDGPKRARTLREAGPDGDRNQTLQEGAVLAYRLVDWFRDGPPDRIVQPPVMRGPVTARTVAAALALLGVVVLIFLGVIAVSLKVFEWSLQPVFDRVIARLFPLLFVPGVLPGLALAVLVIGLPLSQRFRPRGRFITGVCAVAAGLGTVWQVPKLMAALPTPQARVELEGLLFIVGLVVSALLVICGLQLMGSCGWVRMHDRDDDDGN